MNGDLSVKYDIYNKVVSLTICGEEIYHFIPLLEDVAERFSLKDLPEYEKIMNVLLLEHYDEGSCFAIHFYPSNRELIIPILNEYILSSGDPTLINILNCVKSTFFPPERLN